MHTAPVARCGCPAGGPVVAADGKQPVLARRVLFAQDFRGDGEIAVRVQQLAGLRVAMRVVAEIDLAETGAFFEGNCRHFPPEGEKKVLPRLEPIKPAIHREGEPAIAEAAGWSRRGSGSDDPGKR